MKKGFTLIELVCVLTIISIISLMAYPAIGYYSRKDRLKAVTQVLINDLRYAKMYAMTNNVTSVVVRFMNTSGCQDFDGYLIYSAANISNMALKKVLLPDGVRICAHGYGSTFNIDNRIVLKPEGNVMPFACTIALEDMYSGEKRYVTLTIGFTRIMEVRSP